MEIAAVAPGDVQQWLIKAMEEIVWSAVSAWEAIEEVLFPARNVNQNYITYSVHQAMVSQHVKNRNCRAMPVCPARKLIDAEFWN